MGDGLGTAPPAKTVARGRIERTNVTPAERKDEDPLDCVLIVTAANNDGIRAERGKQRSRLLDPLRRATPGSASASISTPPRYQSRKSRSSPSFDTSD